MSEESDEQGNKEEGGHTDVDDTELIEETETSGETANPFAELEPLDDEAVSSEELEDLFEPVETSDIDTEAVWQSVLSENEGPIGTGLAEEGADAIVSKDQYCKRCEFFSEPPNVACTNPGTEIEALVGVDEFRVRNCPVVARRGQAKTVFVDDE